MPTRLRGYSGLESSVFDNEEVGDFEKNDLEVRIEGVLLLTEEALIEASYCCETAAHNAIGAIVKDIIVIEEFDV